MPRLTSSVVAAGSLAGLDQPVLEGEGIALRPWQRADAPAVVAAYRDPGIRQWHARSMDEDEALAWIEAWPTRWRQESDCGWAVTGQGGVLGRSVCAQSLSTRAARESPIGCCRRRGAAAWPIERLPR